LLASLASCGQPPAPVTATVEVAVPSDTPDTAPERAPRPPKPPKPPPPPGPGPLGPFVAPAASLTLPGGSPAQPASDAEAGTLRPRLTAKVAAEGAGMQLDAGPVAGHFQGGDVLELGFMGQPGKCYMAVAVGNGGIAELALEIGIASMPIMPPVVLAASSAPGPEATLGAPNCFKFAMPIAIPVVVRLRAAKGAGLAAAQVLSR
jgi:hypothetical protein